jgi:hypothetical protein
MSIGNVHTILIRRLDFLHQIFLDVTADLAEMQYERVSPRCNHANWLVGHHLWEKDVLLVEWPTGEVLRPDGFTELYGFGSVPQEAGACPDIEELRSAIADLHAPMLAHLTPDSLTEPCVGAPEIFPTRLDTALHFIQDASYHLGQLRYLLKLLEVVD